MSDNPTTTRTPDPWTDEALNADVERWGGEAPGPKAKRDILIAATPDPIIRAAIHADAIYQWNHVGGRFSDCLRSCAQHIGRFASPTAQAIYDRSTR